MNKKRMIILVILVVLIILLIVIGVLSFRNYNKTPSTIRDFGEDSYVAEDGIDDAGELVTEYYSPEEVLEVIQREYVANGVTVQYESEDDDCWYFKDSESKRYSYCFSSLSISALN